MTAALRPRHTLREYLEIERSASLKHEFVAGEVYAMAGGTPEHAALTNATALLLGTQLRGQPCRTYSSDLQIWIEAADVSTYADVTIACDPLVRHPELPSLVTNLRVVVEVLSPSTARYDREQKRLYYQTLESLQEYLLVHQDHRRVEVWRRDGDDWRMTTHDAGDRAPLPSIDAELDVDELYDEAGLP